MRFAGVQGERARGARGQGGGYVIDKGCRRLERAPASSSSIFPGSHDGYQGSFMFGPYRFLTFIFMIGRYFLFTREYNNYFSYNFVLEASRGTGAQAFNIFIFLAPVKRQSAALSSTTQHMVHAEFGRMKYLISSFP